MVMRTPGRAGRVPPTHPVPPHRLAHLKLACLRLTFQSKP